MAKATLTANSPSPLYIAWTTFTIAYGGVVKVIPAGNTNKAWTYWLWNNGVPLASLTSSDVKPTLTDDDLCLFFNRAGIPVSVQGANVIEGSIIATESIVGGSIAANTIDAVKLIADTLTAREIKAGAITASELSISSISANSAINGEMDDVDAATKIPASWAAGYERSGTAPTYAQETNPLLCLAGSSSVKITLALNSVEGLAARATPVIPGQKVMFGVAFRTTVTNVPVTLRAYFGTVDGFTAAQVVTAVPPDPSNIYIFDVTAAGMVPRNDIPTSLTGPGIAAIVEGWRTPVTTSLFITGHIEVPDGAHWVRFMLCSGLPSASGGSPAHTITWDSLEYKLAVSNINMADGAIDGKTITGALVRTSEAGQRIELSDNDELGYASLIFHGSVPPLAFEDPASIYTLDSKAGAGDHFQQLELRGFSQSGIFAPVFRMSTMRYDPQGWAYSYITMTADAGILGPFNWDGPHIVSPKTRVTGAKVDLGDAGGVVTSLANLVVEGNISTNVASQGDVTLMPGGASNSGYMGFHAPDGTRTGFIGYAPGAVGAADGGAIQYYAPNGSHQFFGPITAQNLGIKADVIGPAAQVDGGASALNVCIAYVNVIAGQTYRITGHIWGTQVTSVSSSSGGVIYDDQGGARYCAFQQNLPVGQVLLGTGVYFMTASTTRQAVFYLRVSSVSGAMRCAVNNSRLTVEAV